MPPLFRYATMNYFKSLRLFILLISGLVITAHSYAQIGHQESEKPYWYAFIDGLWVDAGAGLSTIGKSIISDVNMQFGDSTLITIGASRTWARASNYIRSSDYYATAGYIIKKKKTVSAFQAGLSYSMMRDYYYDYNLLSLITEKSDRVGIAVQGKFYYCPIKSVGFGVHIFADVNSHQTHGSILFSIAIGKLNYLY